MPEKKKREIFGMDITSDDNNPKKKKAPTGAKAESNKEPEKEKGKRTTQFFGG